MNFLSQMSSGWNINLFHYRNHGADYGRVLVGMRRKMGNSPAHPRLQDIDRLFLQ